MKREKKHNHPSGQIMRAINGCEDCLKEIPEIFVSQPKEKIEIEIEEKNIVNFAKFINLSLCLYGEPFAQWCIDHLETLHQVYIERLNNEKD